MSDTLLSDIAGLRLARTIYADAFVFVVPSLGGLGNIHLLICSQEHYACLRDCEPNVRSEVSSTVERISNELKRSFGGHTLIFENGSALQNMNEPRCIDHVHVHIVHLSEIIQSLATRDHGCIKQLDLVNIDSVNVSESMDYVAIGWDVQNMSVIQSESIQTQLVRRHIATETGIPDEWNWRDYPRVDAIKRVVKLLSDKF